MPKRQLRVFLCHSSLDKPAVRNLHRRLKADGFAPWLDEEELLPGQDWRLEIPAAISACDILIVCLSQESALSDTYLQREVREVVYAADEKPAGTIWVIPVKLDEVEVPKHLSRWHWANVSQERGYQSLVEALNVHASALGVTVAAEEVRAPAGTQEPVADDEARAPAEAQKPVADDEVRAPPEAQKPVADEEVRAPAEAQEADAAGEVMAPAEVPEPVLALPVEQETRILLGLLQPADSKPQPLPKQKTVAPPPLWTQLRTNLIAKGSQIVAVTLVCAAAVVIVGVLARVYWRKPPRPQSGPGKSMPARTEPVIIPQQAGPVSQTTGMQVRGNVQDGLKYVWIPPGTFTMGCSPRDDECRENEKPPHTVTLSKGIWIGQTEVTVGAYKRFTEATGQQMPSGPNFHGSWVNSNMPIVYVSWNDAHDYCTWAGGRLPTEAEWEYAARGGSAEPRYGNLDEIAWSTNNSGSHPHEVAQKLANGFGLYDTLGNAIEWVNDWYDQDYYLMSPSLDPSGPASGQLRVLRGGSWGVLPRDVRISDRYSFAPADRFNDSGFRCVGRSD